jgi:hypothetical protein
MSQKCAANGQVPSKVSSAGIMVALSVLIAASTVVNSAPMIQTGRISLDSHPTLYNTPQVIKRQVQRTRRGDVLPLMA